MKQSYFRPELNFHLHSKTKTADPFAETKRKNTALMLAAKFGRLEVCQILISKMVDQEQMEQNRVVYKIDQQDERGLNALFYCINGGNEQLCELLLDHGIETL